MEIFIYIFAALISLAAVFLIIEYPYYMVGAVIFMTIYRFNIETPLPLDARGLLTLVLFIRLYIFDKKNATIIHDYLFRNKVFILIMVFSIIVLIIPIFNSEKFTGLAKDIVLNTIVLMLGFLVLIDDNGKKIFIYSILSVSLFSAIDLIYTYFVGGGLNIVRVVDVFTGKKNLLPINHNYPGMLSTFGLFIVYLWYMRDEAPKILLISLGILFFVGLFLSTSRSALLSLFVVFVVMHLLEHDLKQNIKKFVLLGFAIILLLVSYFFAYNLFLKTQSKTEFVDKIYYRLYEEPLRVVGLSKGENFDIYSGKKRQGSIMFRAEKWHDDFKKYLNLDLSVQLLGLGPEKYTTIAKKEWGMWDNLKRQLAAHNGYLILLVERGVIGLLLYLIIIGSIFHTIFKLVKEYQILAPAYYILLFIIFYSFAQNSELVNISAFLIFGAVLGNIYSCENTEYEPEAVVETVH